MPTPTKLSDLAEGESAVIHAMPSGRSGLTRLREMGVVPGTSVTLIRRAPLGEPIEIAVRGSHIAMRNHEASFIDIISVTAAVAS